MNQPLHQHSKPQSRCVVLVTSPASYRAEAFTSAARSIGLDILHAVDVPDALPLHAGGSLAIDLSDLEMSVRRIVDVAWAHGNVAAVIAIDDRGAVIAAEASAALGLPHNDGDSALAARDKFVMRERL